jgi:hypothetical protein
LIAEEFLQGLPAAEIRRLLMKKIKPPKMPKPIVKAPKPKKSGY